MLRLLGALWVIGSTTFTLVELGSRISAQKKRLEALEKEKQERENKEGA